MGGQAMKTQELQCARWMTVKMQAQIFALLPMQSRIESCTKSSTPNSNIPIKRQGWTELDLCQSESPPTEIEVKNARVGQLGTDTK